jgi:hypothetical protein
MAQPPIFGKFFQVGYVVRDIDAATRAAGERFGVTKWHIKRNPAGPLVGLGTAWVGGTMWEYLEFHPEMTPEIFARFLPDDPRDARTNHVGYMLEDQAQLQAVMAQHAASGVGVALHMDLPDVLECYYADSYPQLGHYTEYVYLKPGGRDYFAETPYN